MRSLEVVQRPLRRAGRQILVIGLSDSPPVQGLVKDVVIPVGVGPRHLHALAVRRAEKRGILGFGV